MQKLKAMKGELASTVGDQPKEVVSMSGCDCYGCTGCGYNCSGSAAGGWKYPTLQKASALTL
jgi:ferredoxin-like protein FixX